MVSQREQKVYAYLEKLNIPYIRHEHPPVYTVEEAKQYEKGIPGTHCKNIFLCDKNKEHYYLVVLVNSKKLDFKQLYRQLEAKNLRFAPAEKLFEYLGLEAGAVSPFGLVNDVEKKVEVLIDSDIMEAEQVNFHPNVNTATLTISTNDFQKFLGHCGNKTTYIQLE
ncbi:prolyl-tRNA synthetase associated domain-containing protein [Zhaonella formicivorans]|uniref:prolyl-tRNA synthetase associated domain-containing protein n=1 Tax=Zhaonella formicivorans TaxID=2528593 RepID=UPI0010D713FD|nr:prolyl-tRNA synthetase associated domain-containing protein [Zhaonella formicivorans]